jgi:hypothetical protein
MTHVTSSSKVSLKLCLVGTWAILVASAVPLEVDGHSPVALAEAQATETVTPTETSAPTTTDTPGATASETPTQPDTATPSPTVTGTPPTATPPPAPSIPFLFAASGSEPQNQWECSSSLATSLGLSGAVKTFQAINESDPGQLRNTYKVIYVAPDLNGEDYGFLQQMVALNGTIERFVSSGGVAVINAAGTNGDQLAIAPDDVGFSAATEHDSETIEAGTHRYITGAGFGGEVLGAGDFEAWQHTDLGTLTGGPEDATIVLTNTDGPSWIEYRHGDGRVIVTTLTYCSNDEPKSRQAAARNLLLYSRFFSGSAFTPAPTVPRPTATKPPSFTPTASRTPTPTVTPTESPSPTVTATPVPSSTPSETATETSTATATSTDTPAEATATETATEPAIATLTPTESPSVTPSPTATETATPTATANATSIPTPRCVGDCNGDGVVTVDELLTMVNIGLAIEGSPPCDAGDANGDGQITVDEILLAVNNALSGCPGAVTRASARYARSAKR